MILPRKGEYMRSGFKRIITILLIVAVMLVSSGCYIQLPTPTPGGSDSSGGGQGTDGDTEDGGEVDDGTVEFPDSGKTDVPDEWTDSSSAVKDAVPVRVFLGSEYDLVPELDRPAEDFEWSSRCESICTVDAGVVTPVAPGRTEVTAALDGEAVLRFTVTVEFMISANNGYTVVTDIVDEEAIKVDSLAAANCLIDMAVAEHKKAITIDFSEISTSFTYEDFDLNVELGNHVTFRTAYYESTPYVIRFEITYDADTATVFTPLSTENTYYSVTSANAVSRHVMALMNSDRYTARADDFDGFAINTVNEGEWEVYNSEELWWAVEHGYKPVFPMENSKAELFWERAKILLREIILEGMTDYEKALSIYEYLVDAVAYDYDAYYSNSDKNNVCYYLEGVFERGRAVCDGKTKAFVLLCGMEGIECVRDYGAGIDGGVGHAWNYINLDGVRYLVDTTEGDSHYSADGAIGRTFGYNVEMISYSSFLLPLDHHEARYVYSGIWLTLDSDVEYPSLVDGYFDRDIAEGRDFIIDTKEEMNGIFEALTAENIEVAVLVFDVADADDSPFEYTADADEYGYTVSMFTVSYGEGQVYLAVFASVAAE